jgi:NTE family protein
MLSFSGGGTRAAAFAYGVLRGLDSIQLPRSKSRETLLDRVSIVSGVSGGAFTAANFALFGRNGFKNFEYRFLFAEHLTAALLVKYVVAGAPRRLFDKHFSRSEFAIEEWDRQLFHGRTFGNLEQDHGRPFLLVNATDYPKLRPFPFIQERFDALCGSLSQVTIARAVGASSAFPGALNAVTVETRTGKSQAMTCVRPDSTPGGAAGGYDWSINFARNIQKEVRRPTTEPCGTDEQLATGMTEDMDDDYVHLVDGGVSDNLGVCILMRGMQAKGSIFPLRDFIRHSIKRILVVLVDAKTLDGSSDSPDAPGAFETIGQIAGNRVSNQTDSVRGDFRTAAHRIADSTGVAAERVYLAPLTLLECSGRSDDPVNSMETSFGLPLAQVRRLIQLGASCVNNHPTIAKFFAEYQGQELPGFCFGVRSTLVPCAQSASGADTAEITSPIFFDFDHSEIRPDGAAALNTKVLWLRANPGMRIRLEGNTDERGGDEANLALGKRRVAGSKKYFVEHGISADRFDLESYGEERPVCTEHSEACWKQQRRTDFRVATASGDQILSPLPETPITPVKPSRLAYLKFFGSLMFSGGPMAAGR